MFALILIPIIVILAIILFTFCYKKCPPNKAMVVTGPTGATVVTGRACFVIPFIQRVDYMSLENIQVDFTSRDEIPTRDAINVVVDAVANLCIAKDPEGMKIASSKFLGYSIEDIESLILPVLEGNIREIISQTTLKELIQGDKKDFSEKVIENVTPNLKDMGLDLTTFNIQNFKDKNGVINNLGIENTVQISKEAAKAKAKAEAEIAVTRAQAEQEANAAEVEARIQIENRNNELEIHKANLRKNADIQNADAAAAYGIREEEQRKIKEVATAEANLARQEKEIELKEREVAIQERHLEATVKKTAEAEKFAVQQRADAQLYTKQKQSEADLFERQKNAEAEKFEAEQKAAANIALAQAEKESATAQAAAVKERGEAEAAAIKAKGEAEAAAIAAKLEAEAKGLQEKAAAYQAYNDAAKQQMELDTIKVFFEQLPAIADAVGKGYSNVDKIMMYGGDSSKLAENIMNTTSQISEGLAGSMGIDLKTILAGMLGGKLASADTKEVVINLDENC